MLPSWTDRINIYLHPEQLILVRVGWRFKRYLKTKQVLEVRGNGADPWSEALAALQSALQQPDWRHGWASVVLSAPFVHYRMLPWEEALSSQERIALLRHHYEEVHGPHARHWELAWSDAGYAKPALTCAFDPRLISDLRAVFENASSRLISVKPLLMPAFNRWRKQIAANSAWLVLVEPSNLTIALIHHGEWKGIRIKACEPNWEHGLEWWLERESMLLGVDAENAPVYFWWPSRPSFKPEFSGRRDVRLLQLSGYAGFSPEGGRDVAIAMC